MTVTDTKSMLHSAATSSSERGMVQMSTSGHRSSAPTGKTARSGMRRCNGEGVMKDVVAVMAMHPTARRKWLAESGPSMWNSGGQSVCGQRGARGRVAGSWSTTEGWGGGVGPCVRTGTARPRRTAPLPSEISQNHGCSLAPGGWARSIGGGMRGKGIHGQHDPL
jgi:hypothetical protein